MAAVLLYVCSAFVVWVCCFHLHVQADSVRCPSSCTCLGNNVDCSNLGLINIPKDISGWVTRLELQSNEITEIRPDDLKGLHNLQYLDLSRNSIKVINGSVFKDLTGLQTLKLDYNELTEIPVFPSPLNVTELSITHNHVVKLSMPSLLRMPQLLSLDLSNNYILTIRNGTFPVGCKLTQLTLNNNQLTALDKGCMSNLSLLETLKMNKNKMGELPQGVFSQLYSLKTLELMRNKVRSVKGLTFQGLKELQVLKLKRNNIAMLKDGAFWGLPSLHTLTMDHNKITNVTKAWLFGLKSLKTLSLSHNKIARIEPEAWEPCRQLEKLDLSSNRLTAITEYTLAKLASLDILLLDHNQISRIDDGAFKDLPNLDTLELNSNKISWTMEDVSGAFRGLSSLTKLGLKANAIRSIAVHAFSGLPRLRQLYLEENDITSIQENTFETLRDLRDLRFNSTKLFCDCHLSWLPQWLKISGFQHSAIGTCFHPLVLRGAAIFQVDPTDFKCNNAEFPKPVILEHPKSSNTFKGENMSLICITAITGDSQPSIHWKKDNVLLDDSHSVVTASSDGEVKRYTSNLQLRDIQDNMAGRYQCVVSNDFGSAFSQRAYINVYVFPKFIKKPKNVTVKAGKHAELKCSATGQPTPVISWQKDGGVNFPAARERRMHVYPNDDRFYIIGTRIADEGVYSCMARNEAGVIVANATVTVLETPVFKQPMQGKKATRKGETSVLQCMVSGSPQPKLTWLKDDKEIEVTPRHFFTADNQILVIVDTQSSDSGVYGCRISNSLGTAKGSTELQVLGEAASGSFGLDDESTTTGIIIIAVVCCVVGTSLVWVIIIYQTRKRHEVYSATPTDETTLPGEVPSSGYMSSDKEGSYSQGPLTMAGYHYQDYQMKESGYESSSGQFRVNGYIRPTICHSDVDEDDNHPPTLTAGDRLLRQIKSAASASSLQYPASDGDDTIGSRHSSSSGQHSGTSDPPSSHSGQSGPGNGHYSHNHQHQLHVMTGEGEDCHPSPSATQPQSPGWDGPSEYPTLGSSQNQLVSPDGRPLFQTFHPTKPTNHDRLASRHGRGTHRAGKGEDSDTHTVSKIVGGCGGGIRDKHHPYHSDSCDNRDLESPPPVALHCSGCAAARAAAATTDSSSTSGHGQGLAHVEIHQAGSLPSRCMHMQEDNSSSRHLQSDTSKQSPPISEPPTYNEVMSSHPSPRVKARPPAHSRACVNKSNNVNKQSHVCGGDNALVPEHTQHLDHHGPTSSRRGTPVPGSASRVSTPSPCCCEVVRDPQCCPNRAVHVGGMEGVGGGNSSSWCLKCRSQHHHSQHNHNHHHQHRHPSSPYKHMARSMSSGSVGRDPMYYAHCDSCTGLHADCGCCSCENEDVPVNHSLLCNHPSCANCRSCQQSEKKPLPSSSRAVQYQGRQSTKATKGHDSSRAATSSGRSSSVHVLPSSSIPSNKTSETEVTGV